MSLSIEKENIRTKNSNEPYEIIEVESVTSQGEETWVQAAHTPLSPPIIIKTNVHNPIEKEDSLSSLESLSSMVK